MSGTASQPLKLRPSFLLLFVLLAMGVTLACSRHSQGGLTLLPAALVLGVALWKGRVSWPPLLIGVLMVGLAARSVELDGRGWTTIVPLTVAWLWLYLLPWSPSEGERPVRPLRALLGVAAPLLALIVFGSIVATELDPPRGLRWFPLAVWWSASAMIALPLRPAPSGADRRQCHWMLARVFVGVLFLVGAVLACSSLWRDGVAVAERLQREGEELAQARMQKVAGAQASHQEGIAELQAQRERERQQLLRTRGIVPGQKWPTVAYDDRDEDGRLEPPSVAELADWRPPAHELTREFRVAVGTSYDDAEARLSPAAGASGAAIFAGGGYLYITYFQTSTGWQPERFPAALGPVPVEPEARRTWLRTLQREPWEPDQAEIDARERGVLIYAWPQEPGTTGTRTFVVYQGKVAAVPNARVDLPPRTVGPRMIAELPYSGLEHVPTPPAGLEVLQDSAAPPAAPPR